MKIVFGFEDKPYLGSSIQTIRKYSKTKRKRGSARRKLGGTFTTTSQVAANLEKRYGIVTYFSKAYKRDIVDALKVPLLDTVVSFFKGKTKASNVKPSQLKKVRNLFKDMLLLQRLNGRITGVPTKVARKEGRPSFIKTGNYMNSFTVKVE